MAETRSHDTTETEYKRTSYANPKLADTTTRRLCITLLEHERNVLSAQVTELASRVDELEDTLESQRDVQQVIDHYERIITSQESS